MTCVIVTFWFGLPDQNQISAPCVEVKPSLICSLDKPIDDNEIVFSTNFPLTQAIVPEPWVEYKLVPLHPLDVVNVFGVKLDVVVVCAKDITELTSQAIIV